MNISERLSLSLVCVDIYIIILIVVITVIVGSVDLINLLTQKAVSDPLMSLCMSLFTLNMLREGWDCVSAF